MKRRVVITGLGAVTALGIGAKTLWEGVVGGNSGINTIQWNSSNGNHLSGKNFGAAIPDFDPEQFITKRKSIKVMARDIQLAVAAAHLAWKEADLESSSINHERAGVIVGSGVLNHELDEVCGSIHASLDTNRKLDLQKFGEEGLPNLFPLWLLKYLPNMPACHISILLDLQGPNNTLTTGASAGLQAVGEAFRIIQRGSADVMVCGGAESKLNPLGVSQYQALGVLANSSQDPKKVYKSFDQSSSGIVVGEGAAFLVLEDLEHAQKRGAHIYAEIKGFGCSSTSGQKIAMKSALKEAGVDVGQLDYIQASGLGLPDEDQAEIKAIHSLISNEKTITISSSKPALGFTGFSAGAIDLILSVMAIQKKAVPPTLNCEKPDTQHPVEVAGSQPISKEVKHVMTNAFGLGGQAVSMVIGSV